LRLQYAWVDYYSSLNNPIRHLPERYGTTVSANTNYIWWNAVPPAQYLVEWRSTAFPLHYSTARESVSMLWLRVASIALPWLETSETSELNTSRHNHRTIHSFFCISAADIQAAESIGISVFFN